MVHPDDGAPLESRPPLVEDLLKFERTVREKDAVDRRFLEALLAARSAPKA
jgi:hypothetical protein